MITREEIENIALLSKLSVTEEETEKLTQDLEQMMIFADAVANADTDDIITSDVSEMTFLREDEVRDSLPLQDVLKNAQECCDGYFVVKKNG